MWQPSYIGQRTPAEHGMPPSTNDTRDTDPAYGVQSAWPNQLWKAGERTETLQLNSVVSSLPCSGPEVYANHSRKIAWDTTIFTLKS